MSEESEQKMLSEIKEIAVALTPPVNPSILEVKRPTAWKTAEAAFNAPLPTPRSRIPVTRRTEEMPLMGEWLDWHPAKIVAHLCIHMPYADIYPIARMVVINMIALTGQSGDVDQEKIHLLMRAIIMWAEERVKTK